MSCEKDSRRNLNENISMIIIATSILNFVHLWIIRIIHFQYIFTFPGSEESNLSLFSHADEQKPRVSERLQLKRELRASRTATKVWLNAFYCLPVCHHVSSTSLVLVRFSGLAPFTVTLCLISKWLSSVVRGA